MSIRDVELIKRELNTSISELATNIFSVLVPSNEFNQTITFNSSGKFTAPMNVKYGLIFVSAIGPGGPGGYGGAGGTGIIDVNGYGGNGGDGGTGAYGNYIIDAPVKSEVGQVYDIIINENNTKFGELVIATRGGAGGRGGSGTNAEVVPGTLNEGSRGGNGGNGGSGGLHADGIAKGGNGGSGGAAYNLYNDKYYSGNGGNGGANGGTKGLAGAANNDANLGVDGTNNVQTPLTTYPLVGLFNKGKGGAGGRGGSGTNGNVSNLGDAGSAGEMGQVIIRYIADTSLLTATNLSRLSAFLLTETKSLDIDAGIEPQLRIKLENELLKEYEIESLENTWKVGMKAEKGRELLYEDIKYNCLQEHITQEDWKPNATPSLWQQLGAEGNEN